MHLEGHFTDFIQKERAVVALLETSNSLAMRSGERAFLVSEELALQEIFRDGRAIDRQKALAAPRAVVVDGPRDELLSRTRSPQ